MSLLKLVSDKEFSLFHENLVLLTDSIKKYSLSYKKYNVSVGDVSFNILLNDNTITSSYCVTKTSYWNLGRKFDAFFFKYVNNFVPPMDNSSLMIISQDEELPYHKIEVCNYILALSDVKIAINYIRQNYGAVSFFHDSSFINDKKVYHIQYGFFAKHECSDFSDLLSLKKDYIFFLSVISKSQLQKDLTNIGLKHFSVKNIYHNNFIPINSIISPLIVF